MFDENSSSPTGQSADSADQPKQPKQPSQPMNELPQTGQPVVMPKPRNFEPGTEDIFADTDKTADKITQAARAAQMSGPVGPPAPLTELPDDADQEKSGGGKRVLSLLIAVVVLAGLGAGGYWAYGKFFSGQNQVIPQLNLNQPATDNTNEGADVNNPPSNGNEQPAANENVNTNPPANENVNQVIILDSDKDGLTDDEERTYGTDLTEPDSDGDGLFDKEEIKIYKTNPLDPDTDNDGYLDGAEVKGGYNPSGQGKLLEANFQ